MHYELKQRPDQARIVLCTAELGPTPNLRLAELGCFSFPCVRDGSGLQGDSVGSPNHFGDYLQYPIILAEWLLANKGLLSAFVPFVLLVKCGMTAGLPFRSLPAAPRARRCWPCGKDLGMAQDAAHRRTGRRK